MKKWLALLLLLPTLAYAGSVTNPPSSSGSGVTCSGCTANTVPKSNGTNLANSEITDVPGSPSIVTINTNLDLNQNNTLFAQINIPNAAATTSVLWEGGQNNTSDPTKGASFGFNAFDTAGNVAFSCNSVLSTSGVGPPDSCAFAGDANFTFGVNRITDELGTGAPNFPFGTSYSKLSAAPASAPGAGKCITFVVAGTNAGSCKMQMQCGTSATPVTMLDNVGTGC